MCDYGDSELERKILEAMRQAPEHDWSILELCIAIQQPQTVAFREAIWRLIDFNHVEFTDQRKLRLLVRRAHS